MEMPLTAAYPAGGDVMVENLWYRDAQEGIQVVSKPYQMGVYSLSFATLEQSVGQAAGLCGKRIP